MSSTRVPATAAILAGGLARRFGGLDKSRLVVAGTSIIVRQLAVLQQVAGDVFVVGRDPERFADLGLTVHADLRPGAGALGGIHTALEFAREDRVLVVACDMPFLEAPLLAHLVEAADGHDGAWIRTARGVEPLAACYQRHARQAIAQRIIDGRLRASDLGEAIDMAELSEADVAAFGPVARLLANVNSPDEFARIE